MGGGESVVAVEWVDVVGLVVYDLGEGVQS